MIYKLQYIVNKFIRLIFNFNYTKSVTYVPKNKTMSIEQLFKFEIKNFMSRNFNNLLPSVFRLIFDQNIVLKPSDKKQYYNN